MHLVIESDKTKSVKALDDVDKSVEGSDHENVAKQKIVQNEQFGQPSCTRYFILQTLEYG